MEKQFKTMKELREAYKQKKTYSDMLSSELSAISQILDGLHIAKEDEKGMSIPVVTRLTLAITSGKVNPESINANIEIK